MDIIARIREYSQKVPNRTAMRCGENNITYKELWEKSERLACYLQKCCGDENTPLAVYGHKDPMMLVCFLACVKSGHAYCPIDISVPDARVQMILDALPQGPVLSVEQIDAAGDGRQILTYQDIDRIISAEADQVIAEENWVRNTNTFYIIFTSGSTGTPKGVQISADCLNHYLDWSVTLGTSQEQKEGGVFLNQAPFSFDLSVMDLYTSLACGGTLFCLEKSIQSDYRALMTALKESKARVWVSTPSFAEVCLSEKGFDQEWMPEMEVFLFCGETLANRTAKKLMQRFPKAVVVNTYGPTESTVAVTEVVIDEAMASGEEALPVGKPKPGTCIQIRTEDGEILPEGEKGEIIILGNTVSTGYYQRPDLTQKAFFEEQLHDSQETLLSDEETIRGYHTGDKGFLQDGMLYYCGRIDLQIKLHGYRIELEDIENNIRRVPGVEHAVVLPNMRGGKISSLTAFLVKNDVTVDTDESQEFAKRNADREETAALRLALQEFLPDYMIPKKYVFLNHMPMTNNGKADRKLLGGNVK